MAFKWRLLGIGEEGGGEGDEWWRRPGGGSACRERGTCKMPLHQVQA